MVKLDFLKEHFEDHAVIVTQPENGSPYAKISADPASEPVTVYYESGDPQPYMVRFEHQHIHCSDEAEALRYAEDYLSGRRASIEFFIGDRPCFGGDIESVLPESFTTEYLKSTPFGNIIFSRPIPEGLSFKVRSAKKEFCFDGQLLPDKTIRFTEITGESQ